MVYSKKKATCIVSSQEEPERRLAYRFYRRRRLPTYALTQPSFSGSSAIHVSIKFAPRNTVVLTGNLSISTPDNLSRSRRQSQLADVDLDDGTLRQNTKSCVKRLLGVLLDSNDRDLDRDAQCGMADMGELLSKTHGSGKVRKG